MEAFTKNQSRGFTMVEVLVVVSIISLLSASTITLLSASRAKAYEARAVADSRTVGLALENFVDQGNLLPANPQPSDGMPVTDDDEQWESVWQPLVQLGLLPEVPYSSDEANPYMYYKFNTVNQGGSVFIARHSKPPEDSCNPFDEVDPSYSDASCAPPFRHDGDVNGDNIINGTDYAAIDVGYNAGLSGWENGDFDCNGYVDYDDYTIIDTAYNNQGLWGSEHDPENLPLLCGEGTQEYCTCNNQ